jgi:hypothetical protein
MKRFALTALFGVLLLSPCGSAMAQAPVPGQPYQVPAGYELYGPGSLVSYGGFNYVIQGDETMLLSLPPAQFACQPPVQKRQTDYS